MGKKRKIRILPQLPAGIRVIDTHCHLDMIRSDDNLATVINRAAANGVAPIITVGIDLESSRRAIQLADRYEPVYATVGIHPHNVQQLDESTYHELEKLGRKPKVDLQAPWNGGRGHYGKVFCSVVAGGGFKGGHVVGASSKRGEEFVERPVYPVDLIGSIYDMMGIDTAATLPHPQGLKVRVLPGKEDGAKTGGRLTELI